MQTPAPDTKQMAFAVQILTHANTPQYKSSTVIFPFSIFTCQSCEKQFSLANIQAQTPS